MREYIIEKEWSYKGMKCAVLALGVGHRCGYVGISSDHPLYGIQYYEVSEILQKYSEQIKNSDIGKRSITPVSFIDVHGGITFSEENKNGYPVEKDDLWWFGFDCAHCGDAKDFSIMNEKNKEIYAQYPSFGDGVVRTLDYCIKECESMADQLLTLI